MAITTDQKANLEAARSYLSTALDATDEAVRCCRARGRASDDPEHDALFHEIANAMEAQSRYLCNLQAALELNATAQGR